MTTTALRPPPSARTGAPPPSSPVPAVVASAVVALVVGLLVVEAVVLVAWASDGRSDVGTLDAARGGALAWLLAHRVALDVPGGSFALAPLALTVVVVALLARAGASVARRCTVGTPRRAAAHGAAIALPYSVLATVLTGLSAAGPVRAGPVRTLLTVGLVAAASGAAGALRVVPPPLPQRARPVVKGAAVALGVLAATGVAGLLASLAWHAGTVADVWGSLDVGLAGGFAVLVLCVALLPNAVVWASAYALGTGFAVGAGTTVAPYGVTLGPVPAFPLLAALPGTGGAPPVSLLLLLGPVCAGIAAGVVVARSDESRPALLALATGPLAGVVVLLACWLAGGPAGPGRLATTGPNPWLAATAATEWVGLVGAASAAAYRRLRP